MEFKNFIESYRKLKQSEKTLLNKNQSRYYDQIRTVLKNSNLFKRINSKSYYSKEKISTNYISIVKELRSEPYLLEKFWINFRGHGNEPELNLRIYFSWKKKYILVEKGWFSNNEREVFDWESYNDWLTSYSSWKGGIIQTIERKTNKSYLSESEKELFLEIENIFNKTTIEILKEKEKLQNEIDQKKSDKKKKLDTKVNVILKEFDKNNDGVIDFNQGQDDFMNLLKKHQSIIIEIDQNHVTKFIQISNYLKIKKENIQIQFEKIKKSKKINQLKEIGSLLKNQMDTFNLLSYNSMLMIVSLIEKDLLTFNEIYLTFDKLNIFNSNWENQVSDKLNNIDLKLDDLMFSINKMELSIVNEILKMSIMNQIQMNRLNKSVTDGNIMVDNTLRSLNSSLSSNLKSINSSINVNNLLTGINTYQMYKINKNTKSLRS